MVVVVVVIFRVSPKLQESLEHDPDVFTYPKYLSYQLGQRLILGLILSKRNLNFSLLIKYNSSKEISLSRASVLGQ